MSKFSFAFISGALVRIEGKLQDVPSGFDQPIKSDPSVYVHNFPLFLHCRFGSGIKRIVKHLRIIAPEVRRCLSVSGCTAILHLKVSTYPCSIFSFFDISSENLRLFGDIGLNLEISYMYNDSKEEEAALLKDLAKRRKRKAVKSAVGRQKTV